MRRIGINVHFHATNVNGWRHVSATVLFSPGPPFISSGKPLSL
jgi:hypothetical protein